MATMSIENLVENADGTYSYFDHSKYPLLIKYSIENGRIEVEITKFYKAHKIKEKIYKSKVTKTMSIYQIEEYLLDCVELFLNGK